MRTIEIEKRVDTAVTPSERVLQVAAMFGLGVDEHRQINLVPNARIPLPHGSIIFVTGPSGGGKTTIISLIAQQAEHNCWPVICADALPALADVPLVDAFDLPLPRVTSLLAQAGLGDAFVMLRKPAELSDGQRYRLRIAQLIDHAERQNEPTIIIADEFGATLDRMTAQVVARSLRRWVSKTQHTFIGATTHDDLLESLMPDVLIYKDLGEKLHIIERPAHPPTTDGEEPRDKPPPDLASHD